MKTDLQTLDHMEDNNTTNLPLYPVVRKRIMNLPRKYLIVTAIKPDNNDQNGYTLDS